VRVCFQFGTKDVTIDSLQTLTVLKILGLSRTVKRKDLTRIDRGEYDFYYLITCILVHAACPRYIIRHVQYKLIKHFPNNFVSIL